MSISGRLRTIGRYAWRGVKWLVVIAIVGLVVYIAWTNHRGEAAAERVLRELAARGVPSAEKPALPEHENAARYYLAAAELLQVPAELEGRLPVFSDAPAPGYGEAIWPEAAQALTAAIDANAEAFALLRQIRPDDEIRLDTSHTPGAPGVISGLSTIRRVARWYEVDTWQAVATGDIDRAVDDCLAINHLNQFTASDDFPIVLRVRVSVIALETGNIAQLLARVELNDAQLARLQQALLRSKNNLDIKPSLRRELEEYIYRLKYPRWGVINDQYRDMHMRAMHWEMGPKLAAMGYIVEQTTEEELLGQTTSQWVNSALYSTFVAWCPGYVQLEEARHVEPLLARFDEATDPSTTVARISELAKAEREDEADVWYAGTKLIAMRIDARLEAAIATLEVERFRLREGRWPTGLGEVFDEVPVCAFGHEIHMKRIGHEVRVYSIGENGIDEDGIGWSTPIGETHDGDDWGSIILLDPDQRGRPATVD